MGLYNKFDFKYYFNTDAQKPKVGEKRKWGDHGEKRFLDVFEEQMKAMKDNKPKYVLLYSTQIPCTQPDHPEEQGQARKRTRPACCQLLANMAAKYPDIIFHIGYSRVPPGTDEHKAIDVLRKTKNISLHHVILHGDPNDNTNADCPCTVCSRDSPVNERETADTNVETKLEHTELGEEETHAIGNQYVQAEFQEDNTGATASANEPIEFAEDDIYYPECGCLICTQVASPLDND